MEAEKPAGKRQRTNYDVAFRVEAVRRVNQDVQAATRVAQTLGARRPGVKATSAEPAAIAGLSQC